MRPLILITTVILLASQGASGATVWVSILAEGGADEVMVGPNGAAIPYTIFIETDPLGAPGNLGLRSLTVTIDTDTRAGQPPVSEFVAPFNSWRRFPGIAVDDDLIGVSATQRSRRHPGAISGISFPGIGQSGPATLAKGVMVVPASPVGTIFHASVYINPGLPATSSAFIFGSTSPLSARVPDDIRGNTLIIRVVSNPLSSGDLDDDGDVDLADFLRLAQCFTESGQISTEGCQGADLDSDGDVDLADLIAFQAAFSGSR